ncbi:hypothetical protein LQ567_22225 [Niabella pedocola]|uniref:Uncharacterized protein n=1 Tax=Niabella pedocola TaxID=1752077 RepID=A0ABS8PWU2_9BACT|nr:hypothetical protein [Niabella pedocola]MCD2425518.1 hypothetical protein [Niabella pedocola]
MNVNRNPIFKKYGIKERLRTGFKAVLDNHSMRALDITTKELRLDFSKIEVISEPQGLQTVKSNIIQKGTVVGYYALVLTENGDWADDFFVIF